MTMILDQFGWETEEKCSTVITAETENGKIRIAGDVSPGEAVTITATNGFADTDITVNGDSINPTDADKQVKIVVPDDGELTIVVEPEHAKHKIHLTESETGMAVSSSSVSSCGSSVSMSTSTSISSISMSGNGDITVNPNPVRAIIFDFIHAFKNPGRKR